MPKNIWNLILDGAHHGSYNMAVDEALLTYAANQAQINNTYVRFYQWTNPTLSLGVSQKASKVINFDFCNQNGIDLVRRPTGGKAVLHHQEITYSVISNDFEVFSATNIIENYKKISQALVLGFKKLGLETSLATGTMVNLNKSQSKAITSCFALANHYEILCNEKKLVGSAQKRLINAFLQHGSILLDFDANLLNKIIKNVKNPNLDTKITSIKECLGHCPPIDEIINCLENGFAEVFNIDFKLFVLNQELQNLVRNLRLEKYKSLEPAHVAT